MLREYYEKLCVHAAHAQERDSAFPPSISAGKAAFVICPERGSSYFCGEIRREEERERKAERSLGRAEGERRRCIYRVGLHGPLVCALCRCLGVECRSPDWTRHHYVCATFSPRVPILRSMSPLRPGTAPPPRGNSFLCPTSINNAFLCGRRAPLLIH